MSPGIAREHDVLVSWRHKQLMAALRTGDPYKIPSGGSAPSIELLPLKGKTAFSFLRSRFGL
ncbi:MAG: hypothetical protein L3K18_02320 [Thermoplasmata archaeon]|nr:hypothetical protein [Thermoplasmata archaeon]MCI4355966.1 hypothetical protein [Thermoplasmata archaeon]